MRTYGIARQRYEFAGITVDAVTPQDLNTVVHLAVSSQAKTIIGNHNLHSVYLHETSRALREFCRRAEILHIDGMGVVVLGRILGHPLTREMRINYSRWFDVLLPECHLRGYRIAFLGAAPGVAEEAARRVQLSFPGLSVYGHHGFFDTTKGSLGSTSVLEWVGSIRPNILVVGLGMPRQERWVVENYDEIEANVILNGGGVLELLAGALPEPPRWLGMMGMEWLYRLITRPRRVWFRYLVEPWVVAFRVIWASTGRSASDWRGYDKDNCD